MSRLLEILGRAMESDLGDLILHWFEAMKRSESDRPAQWEEVDEIVTLLCQAKAKEAEKRLQLYRFENPHCPRAAMAAAVVHLQNNKIQKALEQLRLVYNHQPNNTMALYAIGYCCERLGREAEAIEFYQDCLKFKNYLQLPRQRLAAIYFKNHQLQKTLHEYELLQREFPDDMLTLLLLGHLYLANGQYCDAADVFNNSILIHPDNFHSDDDIDQLIRAGQHYEAMEQIELLLIEQPERIDLLIKKADVLAMIGESEQSISHYQQAIRLCPDYLEATIKLGTQFLHMQHHQLAALQFNQAAEINDQIVDSYIGLATARKLDGNNEDALATISLAGSIQPNSLILLAQTASLQLDALTGFNVDADTQVAQDLNAAIETIIAAHNRALLENPQNPDLYYRLGILKMAAGCEKEAIDLFRTVLNINPDFARAGDKMAICLYSEGKKSQALEQLAAPKPVDPDTMQLYYKIAILYCDKVKFASSLINLEQNMNNNFAADDTTIPNISVVLQNLGLLDRATAMWDNIHTTVTQSLDSPNI